MKATPKFAIDIEKWIIYIETNNGEILPVGKVIDQEIGLFKISKWDTKEKAEEWIISKGLVLNK